VKTGSDTVVNDSVNASFGILRRQGDAY
jgi:hypothetical protein